MRHVGEGREGWKKRTMELLLVVSGWFRFARPLCVRLHLGPLTSMTSPDSDLSRIPCSGPRSHLVSCDGLSLTFFCRAPTKDSSLAADGGDGAAAVRDGMIPLRLSCRIRGSVDVLGGKGWLFSNADRVRARAPPRRPPPSARPEKYRRGNRSHPHHRLPPPHHPRPPPSYPAHHIAARGEATHAKISLQLRIAPADNFLEKMLHRGVWFCVFS